MRDAGCGVRDARSAFTLIEVLLTVAILAVISAITVMAFNSVTTAWRKSMVLSDHVHHGDYVMDQLVLALRSAYYPQVVVGETYGFWFEDGGEGPEARDVVSWVKLGGALVGGDIEELENVESPHRVEFFVGEDDTGASAAAVRGWAILGQPEDFDPDDVAPRYVARRIVGFNCRMQDPEQPVEDEIEWVDEWDNTNRLPYAVEVTLWLEAPEEGDDPVALRRVVSLPLAPLSWGRIPRAPAADSGKTEGDRDREARREAIRRRGGAARGGGPRRGDGPPGADRRDN